jgi:hypothetical protein
LWCRFSLSFYFPTFIFRFLLFLGYLDEIFHLTLSNGANVKTKNQFFDSHSSPSFCVHFFYWHFLIKKIFSDGCCRCSIFKNILTRTDLAQIHLQIYYKGVQNTFCLPKSFPSCLVKPSFMWSIFLGNSSLWNIKQHVLPSSPLLGKGFRISVPWYC